MSDDGSDTTGTPPIRVLVLVTSSFLGGAERLILQQVPLLDGNGLEMHGATLRTGTLEQEFHDTLPRYLSLDSKRRFSFRTLFALRRYIRGHNIHILHTHLQEADAYGFLLKLIDPQLALRLTVISTRHNKDAYRKRFLWRIVNRIVSVPFKRIVCVSGSVERFIRSNEWIPRKKLQVIHNGIDTTMFHPSKQPSKQSSEQTSRSTGSQPMVIGMAGRLDPQKGHRHFIEALRILNEHPDTATDTDTLSNQDAQIDHDASPVHGVIAGTGALEQDLKAQCRDRGVSDLVKFVGHVDDLPEFLSSLDIFCFPSDAEGLPTILMEAMACECAVICSDIDSNLEIVEDGKTGIVFRQGNSADLAEKITAVHQEKYNTTALRRAARMIVVERFGIDRSVQDIRTLYESFATSGVNETATPAESITEPEGANQ